VPVSVQQALRESDSLKSVSDSYVLETELLLSHVLDKSREYLRSHGEDEIPSALYEQFQSMLHRRQQGEPVAYILGHREFWDFDLKVNSSVLIPRPETELLVERCLARLESRGASLRIADLGTGSGAIAIAIARSKSDWQVDAVDISEDALALARENASTLGVNNIEFHLGSWCDGLPDVHYDLIVANPPYVKAGDRHLDEGDLPFEPNLALIADDSGYAAFNSIMKAAPGFLKKDAWLLMEHGYDQQAQLIDALVSSGYEKVAGYKDYAGVDRIVEAVWSDKF